MDVVELTNKNTCCFSILKRKTSSIGMGILLFVCAVALLFERGSSSVLVQPAKLGQTVKLEFGAEVMNVQAEILEARSGEKDRMDIVTNGAITDYGRERYGNRLSFKNGALIIKNLTANDGVSYFYFVNNDPKKPAAIDVVIQ
ncbi:unnamed protein product [Litomosoides sigmodontis]|uniref:Immunoglobulin subtype domain-containing protein n=1 Tax=Litomosoides sigmodontis TaxID=42156 RepID=A0A3P6T273_LITSI|nr:unnamed protein product [Litomosoides sigmodontis]